MTRGFLDLPILESDSAAERDHWFGQARRIAAQMIRLDVDWGGLAPKQLGGGFDPANPGDRHYQWRILDAAVRTATADGMQLMLTVYDAPAWAEGSGQPAGVTPGSWRPSPSDLATFEGALATRYDGHFPDPRHAGDQLPRVSIFEAWNEPNLETYITPQWVLQGGHWEAESPTIYRSMLNAGYAAIKRVQPAATVLSAGLTPYGRPPGAGAVAPAEFMRDLLCLSTRALTPVPCLDPAHFDAYDTHPYSAKPTSRARAVDDVSVLDMGKLQRIVRRAIATGRALPDAPKPLWVTEVGWSTRPPNPNGLTPAVQARYVALGFYELWRQGISHVLWFTLRDSSTSSPSTGGGGGLYFGDGRPKAAARAFAFPFVAVPARHSLTLWGQAPGPGIVAVQRRITGGWQTVATERTTADGIFYAGLREAGHPMLRAKQGAHVSLPYGTG